MAEIDPNRAEIYGETFYGQNFTLRQSGQSNGVMWEFNTALQNKANVTLTISKAHFLIYLKLTTRKFTISPSKPVSVLQMKHFYFQPTLSNSTSKFKIGHSGHFKITLPLPTTHQGKTNKHHV